MSCDILQSIIKGCENGLGGLKKIYFTDSSLVLQKKSDSPSFLLSSGGTNTYTTGSYELDVNWISSMEGRYGYESIKALITVNSSHFVSNIQIRYNDNSFGFDGSEIFEILGLDQYVIVDESDPPTFEITVSPRNGILSDNGYISDISLESGNYWSYVEFARDSANYIEERKSDFSIGVSNYETTISLSVPRRNSTKSLSFNKLIEGQRGLKMILVDMQNIYWFLGEYDDVYLSQLGEGSGSKIGDGSKYSVQFMSTQNKPMPVLTNTAISNLNI